MPAPSYMASGVSQPISGSRRRRAGNRNREYNNENDLLAEDYAMVDNGLPEQDDLTQAVEKGSRCDAKELYFVPREDDSTKLILVDEKPANFENVEKGKTRKAREAFAVNVLHRFEDDLDEWVVAEVRVNSVKLHEALEKILEGCPGLTQHELKSFSPPFIPFVHRWQDMLEYMEGTEKESEMHEHLKVLRRVLEPLLEKSFATVRDVEKTGHVAFSDLPLVYIPGSTVLKHETKAAGVFRSCRYARRDNCPPRYEISVDVVQWDGRRCGLFSQTWRVFEYAGLRALISLAVSPLNGLPDETSIRKDLIQRGRIYERLRGQHFLAFTDKHGERANERMVVDARALYKYEASSFPEYASLEEIARLTWAQSMNRYSSSLPSASASSMETDLSPLTDEQRLLAEPTVWSFNIEKKKWEWLDVTKFHEIAWAEHAFDSLVLAQDEKDLLLALVDRDQFSKAKPFEDFIGGKGQGMIMLLCGPPGVGKTLTAESVAEHLHRPLYKLGAGDLGTDAHRVEANLGKALKLCAHFGAVLLIDEADVFMEARSSNNLQRNELVSVFLRLLEYYSGIMILTTNRMKSIDAAFESRVDITLSYSPLTKADRAKVWKNFLATLDADAVDVGEADLSTLAEWDFNGRQIKSAIKTARILAAKKREPLNARHLNVVLNLRNKALGMMNGE
ncbi:P-loop containing nucleoside triphosphate hydrolase protein [Ophiobolus disseminans]|uniref:P-loop containing nucleoside triphosphate hydrolase protein n=1 Tax=Ophiobolus disseminans TaxID=1469910 RepID=A0A6A7A747_9PLEO|nr:P-loop containing nucleoside triphosphate hydrolase protein [Ophiobolus disseminans]